MISGGFIERNGWDRRRRRLGRFVVRERRSGFERRGRRRPVVLAKFEDLLVFLRDHPVALIGILALGNLLSAIDALMTVSLLRLGVIEGNPIMSYFFAGGPAQAIVFKCAVVAAASLGIWALRRYRVSLEAAVFLPALYGAVVLYEVVGLVALV